MLTAFGPSIWLADGPILSVAGFRYPTRMAVIRLTNGDLILWSPVARTGDLVGAVSATGRVVAVVAPTPSHHLVLADWLRAFPRASFLAAPGLSARRPDLPAPAELRDTPPAAWAGQIEILLVPNLIADEVFLFHRASRTLLVADLIQHFHPDWFTGWRRLVARLDRMVAPRPEMPRKFRLAIRDRAAARNALACIRAWQPERLVMAHGEPLEQGAIPAIEHAFRWLGR